jgi:hypothetical protein
MPMRISLTAGELSDEYFDRLSRECANDVAALPGVDLVNEKSAGSSAGYRGDPVTLGTIALALITSGTVTALFAVVKSYVERGIEASFQGVDRNGKPINVSLKGASFEQFKHLLESADVVK